MSDTNWRQILLFSLFSLILLTMSGAGLLALGLANPPHASKLAYDLEVTPFSTQYPLPVEDFTLDLYATIPTDASLTTAWGLWLENEQGQWLIVALNGAQYVTVRQCPLKFTGQLIECPPLTNTQSPTYWQRFHHIQPNGTKNHLRINYVKNETESNLAIWLNDEWVYTIPLLPLSTNPQWGYWQSPTTVIEWHLAESRVWINQPTN